MSTDLLFEQFATLATAPDGIARLRELILQLAVQGKLGTQDAGDEPANALLKKIRSVKERLENDGKIKKERNLPLSTDEIIFEIPKKWEAEKIGNICFVTKLAGYEYTKYIVPRETGDVPLIRALNLKNFKFNRNHLKFIDSATSKMLERSALTKPAILITYVGYVGEIAIFDETQRCHLGPNVAKIEPFYADVEKILLTYLLLFLKSECGRNEILKHEKSTAQPSISMAAIRDAIVLIPPLAEQHRIVAKIDRLMALCDELEARQQQERAGCLKLGTASLAGLQNADSPVEFEAQWAQVCDAFDLILDCPENVAVLRQTILQLAVQGRLGTNNPDEKSIDSQININKNKLEGNHTTDTTEEISSLSLPNNWIFTSVASISSKVVDGVHRKPDYRTHGIPFLTVRNLTKGKFIDFSDVKYISKEEHHEFFARAKPEINDILITKDGTIGVTRKIRDNIEFSIFVSLALIKPIDPAISDYLELALSSPQVQAKMARVGAGLKHLVLRDLNRLHIPLPPLAEQHRIVAKVDSLMTLCDALESQLKERAGVQGRLAGAVVKQVAG